MTPGQRRQTLFLMLTWLLMSLIVNCGNADSGTDVRVPQGPERRNLTASENPSTTQVALRITGMS